MAREITTRGRSALSEHDVPRRLGIALRLRPTRRGVSFCALALALLGLALGTGDSALLLVLAVVALPLVVAPVVVLLRAHGAAHVEMHMMVTPPLAPVGAPCDLLLQLSHAGGGSLPPMSLDRPSDHWVAGLPDPRRSVRPARPLGALATDTDRLIRWDRIGSESSVSSTLPLPTRRRGVFTVGPLRLWVHDPFALFGLTVAIARPVTLVVHPLAVTVRAPPTFGSRWSGETQTGVGPTGVHADDPGGEWSGLRPYEPGDRLHLLSWQAEARSGALLVHDFRPDSEDTVTIVFDDRAGVHRRHAFESALGTVVGLATAAQAGPTDYDVSTLSGRRVRGSTSPEGLVALLTFLAETQPTRSGSDLAATASVPPVGAVLITTSTAVPILPSSFDRGSFLVAE